MDTPFFLFSACFFTIIDTLFMALRLNFTRDTDSTPREWMRATPTPTPRTAEILETFFIRLFLHERIAWQSAINAAAGRRAMEREHGRPSIPRALPTRSSVENERHTTTPHRHQPPFTSDSHVARSSPAGTCWVFVLLHRFCCTTRRKGTRLCTFTTGKRWSSGAIKDGQGSRRCIAFDCTAFCIMLRAIFKRWSRIEEEWDGKGDGGFVCNVFFKPTNNNERCSKLISDPASSSCLASRAWHSLTRLFCLHLLTLLLLLLH